MAAALAASSLVWVPELGFAGPIAAAVAAPCLATGPEPACEAGTATALVLAASSLSLTRITTVTVSPTTATIAIASRARRWLNWERSTTAGCCLGIAWPMTASCPGAAAWAACPIVFAGNLIDDDHAPGRFPLAYRPVTARQRRPGVGLAPVGGRTRGGAQTPWGRGITSGGTAGPN